MFVKQLLEEMVLVGSITRLLVLIPRKVFSCETVVFRETRVVLIRGEGVVKVEGSDISSREAGQGHHTPTLAA